LAQVSETHDPETFAEASGHPDWDTAMNEEYHSLMENDTWDLVPLPKGRKLVRCKWVYRTKYASDGSIERHKARLVAKGFSQVEGIDYNETFAQCWKNTERGGGGVNQYFELLTIFHFSFTEKS
jgi:hypothetical protein